MKNISISVLFVLGQVVLLTGQDAIPTLYAESFRHGATRVTEESFEMKLNPENSTYRELIKDTRGNDRFAFTVAPQVLEGDTKVISWQARLVDLRHPIYNNILVTSQEPSSARENNLSRLDPDKFAAVPVRAKRIIKVDGFYVTMQIKTHHFTPLDSPYLDSMTVQVDFKNADPRTGQSP